jgi:hypothetical protein
LIVARQDPVTRSISPIGVLEASHQGFSFSYFRRVLDMPGFRPLLGFADLERRYGSPALFPLFSQRLMDPRRPDYGRYLAVLGLGEGSSPMVVLGRSGGRRAGDSIFLVPEPHVSESGQTSATFFVHGLRHIAGNEERISRLQPGESLALRDDLINQFNPSALLVTHDGVALGWVPDLLLDYVHHARDRGGLALRVVQVNGPDTPPNLRLLVELTGSLPPGYEPFRGKGWDTTA